MTRAEFRWVLLASLAVILFASLPTIYAWSQADADHVFTGFVYNTEDGNSYIAKMRLGARGEWFFHLSYTPEAHEGALALTFHLLLGKLSAGLGLSFVFTYHLARVLFGLALLLMVYAFVAQFTSDVTTRRLAWLLVATSSGLGWLLTILGATHWLGDLPLDFWVPEAYVFLVLYSLPHLALAEALLLWSILCTLRAFAGQGTRWCLCSGLAALIMAWIVPFYAGVLAAVLGAYLLALLIRRRRMPYREAGLAILTGLFALPPVVYNAWVFTANPAFRIWAAQNRILSPHPLHYLLGYALLLIPAVWAGIHAIREGEERWLLPVAWMLVVPFLLYMPFNLQRRMIAVAQVPLALLAAVGLRTWIDGMQKHVQRRAVLVYVAVAGLSNLLLVFGSIGLIREQGLPIYRSHTEVEALNWLNAQASPDEIVLASFETGNAIPALTDLRVFAGHGPETLQSVEKQDMIRRFFAAETGDDWRRALLAEFDLDYVYWGPLERALGDWNPAAAPYLHSVYEGGGIAILRVGKEEVQP